MRLVAGILIAPVPNPHNAFAGCRSNTREANPRSRSASQGSSDGTAAHSEGARRPAARAPLRRPRASQRGARDDGVRHSAPLRRGDRAGSGAIASTGRRPSRSQSPRRRPRRASAPCVGVDVCSTDAGIVGCGVIGTNPTRIGVDRKRCLTPFSRLPAELAERRLRDATREDVRARPCAGRLVAHHRGDEDPASPDDEPGVVPRGIDPARLV